MAVMRMEMYWGCGMNDRSKPYIGFTELTQIADF